MKSGPAAFVLWLCCIMGHLRIAPVFISGVR